MTLIEWFKVKKTLWIMARMQGLTIAQVRRSIEVSIDEAWRRVWTPGNLKDQVIWQELFPGGEKPTVEEFIVTMGRKLSDGEDVPYILG